MSVADLFRGARGLSKPPIDNIESYWTAAERAQAAGFLSRSIIGSPETVRTGIRALVEETGADELMIVSDIFDHDERLRSYELIAEAASVAQVSRAA
jgi:alkanesulfonate monooxygenase SsuD/methylene tetrahydromethanopterin reductase-like flavin-dependent oxidoreductase (luciferase family)